LDSAWDNRLDAARTPYARGPNGGKLRARAVWWRVRQRSRSATVNTNKEPTLPEERETLITVIKAREEMLDRPD
jgi:hypothetical protein